MGFVRLPTNEELEVEPDVLQHLGIDPEEAKRGAKRMILTVSEDLLQNQSLLSKLTQGKIGTHSRNQGSQCAPEERSA